MLILILIDVQYSQNAVFSFEKGLNHQNHSPSGSHHPVKNSPSKISDSPNPHCYMETPEVWGQGSSNLVHMVKVVCIGDMETHEDQDGNRKQRQYKKNIINNCNEMKAQKKKVSYFFCVVI